MNILIVDDHPIVRAGLKRLLSGEPDMEAQEAASGNEALIAFRQHRPDLVILDLNLPGISGLEVITRLKVANPEARILVLSMHDDHVRVTRALQAGASGYLSKNAPPDELLEAIRRVATGLTYVEHDIAQALAFSKLQSLLDPLGHLSARDLEILHLLAQGSSLAQIADAAGISYKTAANNCSQLKAKLGVASTADLIRVAVQYDPVEIDDPKPATAVHRR